MKGGKYFCTLDIYKAYLHLEVNDESKRIQTISTHRGVYVIKHLAFGIKTAPKYFQRVIDDPIADLERNAAYFNDIIQGRTIKECREKLIKFFKRMGK